MKNILPLIVAISMVAPAQDVSPSSMAQVQAELNLAIVAGNIEAIQSALNKGAPINGAFDERFNPLCLASLEGNMKVVKYLLKSGADINWLNKKSNSALSAALFAKHSEIALYLIAQGCDLGSMSKDEPNKNLTYAAQSGLTLCVEALLKRGVPAEGMGEEGSMPLFVACQYGHTDIIRLLIKYGCDFKDPRYTRLFSPLAVAAYRGHFESLKLLLEQGMDCNAAGMGPLSMSPILMASQAGHADCVALLLAHGADPNAKIRFGVVPLVSAAQHGHGDCVDILLAHPGISIDNVTTGLTRRTALNGASTSHPELVQRLLDAGCNPNIKDEDGVSPLLNLSKKPLPLYQIAAIALIEAGADINARNDDGESPLLQACKGNNLRLAEILLALGADASPKDSTGRTAHDYAREASRAELLALFDKGEASALSPEQRAQLIQGQREHFNDARAQARTQNELTAAIKADKPYLVEEILQNGAQINGLNIVELPNNAERVWSISIGDDDTDTDTGGIEFDSGEVKAEETDELIISPLAYACALNNQKIIKLLLGKGADINQLIGFESSALSFAISYSHVDLARDLMKLGAKLQLSPGNDQHMLFSCLWQGNRELFQQLIKAGAQLNLESNKCAETFYLLSKVGKYQEAAELMKLGFDEKNAARMPIKFLDKSFAFVGDMLHNISMTKDDKANLEARLKKRPSLLYFVSNSAKPHELADLIGLGALSNGDLAEQKAIVKALYQAKMWREMKTFAAGEMKNGKSSMIIAAASLDSVDAMRSCIVSGTDINVKNAEGQSALAILTSLGNVEALDLLLEHGADINSRTNAGRTPLIHACELGMLKVVKYLVEQGADIKATDNYGDDARLYALAAGHEEIVDYLDEWAAR